MTTLSDRQRAEIARLWEHSSEEERHRLLIDVNAALRSATAHDPALHFPIHLRQKYVRESVADVTIALGGNRSGKSTVGKLVVCDVVRRRSPLNRRLTFDTETRTYTRSLRRPLTIWVGVPSLEKARTDWFDPADEEDSFGFMLGDAFKERREQPDIIYETKFKDHIHFKSYEQGFMSFESSSVDLILIDEEPPNEKIVNSCLMRLATNNGPLILAYTPLMGLSWSYEKWFKPLVRQGRARMVDDRYWLYEAEGERSVAIIQMGMADNPRAADEAKKIEADETMLPSEKNARLYGEYGYAEGVFFPRLAGIDILRPSEEHKVYIIDELPRAVAAWYLIADPNHRFGATLWMMDGDGNRIAVHEHFRESWVSREHANVFKAWLKIGPDARQWADFGAAGKYASNELNREHGLKFRQVEKPGGSVSSSIKTVRSWTISSPTHHHPITGEVDAPRIYFYRPGLLQRFDREGRIERENADRSELLEQLSTARQSDEENVAPDTPHKTQKHSLDLFDTARYMALVSRPIPLPEHMNPAHRSTRSGSRYEHDMPTMEELRRSKREVDPMSQPFPSPFAGEESWTLPV